MKLTFHNKARRDTAILSSELKRSLLASRVKLEAATKSAAVRIGTARGGRFSEPLRYFVNLGRSQRETPSDAVTVVDAA